MRLIVVSDEAWAVFVPLAIFWGYSGMYEVVGRFLGRYRLFPREDEAGKNLITKWEAIKGVLFNQAFQIAFSFLCLWLRGSIQSDASLVQPPLYVQATQLLVAILALDIWQYFGHRLLHTNTFLYKHVHAMHHHLVVPYAFGAQYQHPVEALLLDNVGAVLAYAVSRMTPHTAAFFFALTLVKSIDDHCGLWLPGHPFHLVFSNNSAFHTVHHQLYGSKANFSAPYFTFWDKIMGTYMPYTLKKKDDGGYDLKPLNSSKED